MLWRLDQQEPFGDTPPDENPSGLGAFKFPLRGGGWQYADDETGEFWNWYRTYSKSTGRFDQFDPIGLRGGKNGYVYVANDPLRHVQNQRVVWRNDNTEPFGNNPPDEKQLAWMAFTQIVLTPADSVAQIAFRSAEVVGTVTGAAIAILVARGMFNARQKPANP